MFYYKQFIEQNVLHHDELQIAFKVMFETVWGYLVFLK